MAASFRIGTGEFVIVGLVPGLASDLQVTVPTAGLLISVYALSVAFGSPFVAAALSPVSRRRALLGLMLVFVAGDVACVLAPDFRLLLAARVATALARTGRSSRSRRRSRPNWHRPERRLARWRCCSRC